MPASLIYSASIEILPELVYLFIVSLGKLYPSKTRPKHHLKVLRPLCRALTQAANPFVFDGTTISANLEALEVAQSVTEKFRVFVRMLIYYYIVYRKLTWSQFDEEIKGSLWLLEGSYYFN